MSDEIFNVPCPICRQPVVWSAASPFRPFCSKRCQLIDLGEWAAEEKTIPAEPVEFADFSETDPPFYDFNER